MPAERFIRLCPQCLVESIVGHGRRPKQAHDETHDWIVVRRGICKLCSTTFTFLPWYSLPYSHYSLRARSRALQRFFLENCNWEAAAPEVKRPERVADPSMLRRWFPSLDSSPAFPALRRTASMIQRWFANHEVFLHGPFALSWPTLFAFLQALFPLRL